MAGRRGIEPPPPALTTAGKEVAATTDPTIETAFDPRNPEDYTNDCCLLVREGTRLRHAEREVPIEAADPPLVSEWNWKIAAKGEPRKRKRRYVVRYIVVRGLSFRAVPLHHLEIMTPPADMVVDHKLRRALDNRRRFLRVCTHQQNAMNRSASGKGRGKYEGVTREGASRFKWVASITVSGKTIRVGRYDSQAKAAWKYNQAALVHHGEFACLNEIDPTIICPETGKDLERERKWERARERQQLRHEARIARLLSPTLTTGVRDPSETPVNLPV